MSALLLVAVFGPIAYLFETRVARRPALTHFDLWEIENR